MRSATATPLTTLAMSKQLNVRKHLAVNKQCVTRNRLGTTDKPLFQFLIHIKTRKYYFIGLKPVFLYFLIEIVGFSWIPRERRRECKK
jgi:hypothetical protein